MIKEILSQIDESEFYNIPAYRKMYYQLCDYHEVPRINVTVGTARRIIGRHITAIKGSSDEASIKTTPRGGAEKIRGDRLKFILEEFEEHLFTRSKTINPRKVYGDSVSPVEAKEPVTHREIKIHKMPDDKPSMGIQSWLDDDDGYIAPVLKMAPKEIEEDVEEDEEEETEAPVEPKGLKAPSVEVKAPEVKSPSVEIKAGGEYVRKSQGHTQLNNKPSLFTSLKEACVYSIQNLYEIPYRIFVGIPLMVVKLMTAGDDPVAAKDAEKAKFFALKPFRDADIELLALMAGILYLIGIGSHHLALVSVTIVSAFILRVIKVLLGGGLPYAGEGLFREFCNGDRVTRHQKEMADSALWTNVNANVAMNFSEEVWSAFLSLGYRKGGEISLSGINCRLWKNELGICQVVPFLQFGQMGVTEVKGVLSFVDIYRRYGKVVIVNAAGYKEEAYDYAKDCGIELVTLKELVVKASV